LLHSFVKTDVNLRFKWYLIISSSYLFLGYQSVSDYSVEPSSISTGTTTVRSSFPVPNSEYFLVFSYGSQNLIFVCSRSPIPSSSSFTCLYLPFVYQKAEEQQKSSLGDSNEDHKEESNEPDYEEHRKISHKRITTNKVF
jgi:hypothetical protein